MARERMSLKDYFNQNTCNPQDDHLYSLRVRLLEEGHIQSLSQKCVYTDEGKQVCLDWYLDELDRQTDLGSTGSWGKQFEVESRIRYAIRRGVPYRISDTKCRTAGLRDMTIRVDGGNYAVELKTGRGAVGYGTDKADALEDAERFFSGNPIICWDFEANGRDPLCMKATDLLEALDSYKRGISTWLSDCPNVDKQGRKLNRSYQINLDVTEGPKMEYLRSLRNSDKALNWQKMMDWAEF